MFLRHKIRRKDGKEHRYWSVVENKRVSGGRVVQKHVLYLGEINGSQELAWRKSIEVLEDGDDRPKTLALFPEDRCEGVLPDASIVRLKLSDLRLRRPRQWGACWLALHLWRNCGSIGSGPSVFRPAARGPVGIRSCSCWSPIGCWRRAANGGCIGRGSNAPRWLICWAPTSAWRRSTSSIAATTACWSTRWRCSTTWWTAGGICSAPASTFCSTI